MGSEVDIEEEGELFDPSLHLENLDMDMKSLNSSNELHQLSSCAGQVSAVGSLEEDLLYPY